ncbi:MAG: GntR family transcriptional regulator [Clostridia bacterium]|nr:GntR family transcriptional regulator [Clostridia bacterium]
MELKRIAEEMQPRTMAARDWVFQVIRTAIVRGVLQDGMPLRQDEISAALSVSHIPVREAFRQLEAQGLVRIYPNRGAVVTKLTKQEMANIMDTRIILELGAIRAAFPYITDEILNEAAALIDLSEGETDLHKIEDLNLQFHFLLYSPANNKTMFDLIETLHANVDRYIRQFYITDDGAANREHRALIDACRNKDIVLADAVLRTHLERCKRLLMNLPNVD